MGDAEQAEAQFFRALSLIDSSDFQGAELLLRDALKSAPQSPAVLTNLALVLLQQRKHVEARKYAEKAASAETDDIRAQMALGDCYAKENRLSDALACYNKCIALDPTMPSAFNNCGVILTKLGLLTEAADRFRSALMLQPNFSNAHANLGFVLLEQGKLREARHHCERAIALTPNMIEGYLNLAKVLILLRRDPARAIEVAMCALRIDETPDAIHLFADCLVACLPGTATPELQALVIRAVSEVWKQPRELAPVCARLIKQKPALATIITRACSIWPRHLPSGELFGVDGLDTVAADPLLRCLLESTSVADFDIERFLTAARLDMLGVAERTPVTDIVEGNTLRFYCAIARQCFINEYIFSLDEAEFERAQQLRRNVAAATVAGLPIPMVWLVTVAAYFPLYGLPAALSLLGRAWPESVSALLDQQVREPDEERHLRESIRRLTPITDEVSLLVKAQYEENPYPRWVISPVRPLSATVDIQNASSGVRDGGAVRDVLVAGCGTGLQAIQAAQTYAGARILAVDLSLSSLGYAQRQTRAAGVQNIEYAQADILRLGSTGRTFDAIWASGVLHHLGDPWAGWRVLLSLLRPGGMMYVGLYSELGGRDLTVAKKYIQDRKYTPTAESIRRCRQELMSHASDGFGVARFRDFFNMSECRDMLFHVREERFTIPQVYNFLRDNALAFVRFYVNDRIRHQYQRRFPSDATMTNLHFWHIFELENPDTFFGMYNFWVRKSNL